MPRGQLPESGHAAVGVAHYGAHMSRPAKLVAALILVGAVALAIAGYFATTGSDEAYWAPLVPVFVFVYAAHAVGAVIAVDAVVRWSLRDAASRMNR
jgi:peptidoglycan/LPS O-acetylase OafA/YrhL